MNQERYKVETASQFKIRQYIEENYRANALSLEMIDDATIKGVDQKGDILYFRFDEDNNVVIVQDKNHINLQDLFKDVDEDAQISELNRQIQLLDDKKTELMKIWSSNDFKAAYIMRSLEERESLSKKYFKKLKDISEKKDALKGQMNGLIFDKDRKEMLKYLHEEDVALAKRENMLHQIMWDSWIGEECIQAKNELDAVHEKMRQISRIATFQKCLREIVALSNEDSAVHSLDYSTKTTEIMDEFEKKDYLILRNIMSIYGENELFHTKCACNISLIITHSPLYWTDEIEASGITMTDLKKTVDRLRLNKTKDGIFPVRPFPDILPTPLTKLVDQIVDIYDRGSDGMTSYKNIILFPKAFLFKGQSTGEYEELGYGRAMENFIVGAVYDSY